MVNNKKFINANPNLHIDLLKSQYAVFSVVLARMLKDNNPLMYELDNELWNLNEQIKQILIKEKII
jgi:hypothetical protein